MAEKHIPISLYPCTNCHDDFSWPANFLFWSEKLNDWCCDNCWAEFDEHWEDEQLVDLGISLAEELSNRELKTKV